MQKILLNILKNRHNMRKLVFCFILMLATSIISFAQNVIDPELQSVINQKNNEKMTCNFSAAKVTYHKF